MKRIAIIGMGAIGSSLAVQLARAGVAVTGVARGERFAELAAIGAVQTAQGPSPPITVVDELPTEVPYDLVIVSVRGGQVGALLPVLRASAARTVLFMFNWVGSVQPLRAAVGEARAAFAFPAIVASMRQGILHATIHRRLQVTVCTSPVWAAEFARAGIPTEVVVDIESWLTTHAALMAPILAAGEAAAGQAHGLDRRQAWHYARVMARAGDLVRQHGYQPTPRRVAWLLRAPWLAAPLMWVATRSARVRAIGAQNAAEAHALLEALAALAPSQMPR